MYIEYSRKFHRECAIFLTNRLDTKIFYHKINNQMYGSMHSEVMITKMATIDENLHL